MDKPGRNSLKQMNKRNVLRAFAGKKVLSRAEIGESTGLSQATISNLMTELMREGHVRESGRAQSSGGRRAALYRLGDSDKTVLSISLARDGVQMALIDFRCNALYHYASPGPVQGEAACIRALEKALEELLASGVNCAEIQAVGVSVPGILDCANGRILYCSTLDVVDFDLNGRFGLVGDPKVFLFKDTDAMLLWEYHFALGEGNQRIGYLLCDWGIGFSMLQQGDLMARSGSGLELGDVVLSLSDPSGNPQPSTIGDLLSGVPAVRRYCVLYERENGVPYYGRLSLTYRELISMHLAGDDIARRVAEEQLSLLAVAVANVVNLFTPQILILSSPLCRLEHAMEGELADRLRQLILPPYFEDLRILPARNDENALLGMAGHILRTEAFPHHVEELLDNAERREE